MKKINWKIMGLVLVVILIIAGIFGLYFYKKNSKSQSSEQENTSPTADYYQGQVEYIEGQVEKRESPELGWLTAEKSDLVKAGNEIRTFNDSRAVITFEDGSALRMDADTEISFQPQENNIEVILKKGTIFNKVAKNENRTYTVAAGEFKVVALGTAFSVEQQDDNDTKVMVLESQVQVTDKDNNAIEKIETGEKAKLEKESIKQENIKEEDTEDKFIAWSIKEEKLENVVKEEEQKKEEEKKEEITSNAQIVLTGSKSDKGVKLSWKTTGVSIPNGFKLVKSTEKNPVYPGNEYIYLSNSDIRSYEWKIDTGKQYYFRICAYQTNGTCGLYSNNLLLDTPSGSKDDDYASKITLSVVDKGDDYVKLKWDISGGKAPNGFKIVKDTKSDPTYPSDDDWEYESDKDARSFKWTKNLKDGKKYYFRVCVYLGGKCGTYSNNVSVEF